MYPPESETGKGLAVPLPFADKAEYHQGLTNRQINHAIRAAPVEKRPIEGLHAIQHSVQRDRVEQYVEDPNLVEPGALNPKSKTPIDHPVEVERFGKRWLHDGHHRVTAEILKGKKEASFRVVRLPDKP